MSEIVDLVGYLISIFGLERVVVNGSFICILFGWLNLFVKF